VGSDSSSGIKTAAEEKPAAKEPASKETASKESTTKPEPEKTAEAEKSATTGDSEKTVAMADLSARPSDKSEKAGDEGDNLVARATPEGGRLERAEDGMNTYDVEADFRSLRRTFHYNPVNTAQHYLLNFNPAFGGRAAYYPLRNVGVFVQGEFSA